MLYYLTKALCIFAGLVYPAYRDYKVFKEINLLEGKKEHKQGFLGEALGLGNVVVWNEKNQLEVKKFVKYWIVFAWFIAAEFIADFFLYIIPFYGIVKLVFVLWLSMPQTNGAIFIYDYVLQPNLEKYSDVLDEYLLRLDRHVRLSRTATGGAEYNAPWIVSASDSFFKGLISNTFKRETANSGNQTGAQFPNTHTGGSSGGIPQNIGVGDAINAINKIGELFTRSGEQGVMAGSSHVMQSHEDQASSYTHFKNQEHTGARDMKSAEFSNNQTENTNRDISNTSNNSDYENDAVLVSNEKSIDEGSSQGNTNHTSQGNMRRRWLW